MRTFMVFDMAKEYADRQARRHSKEYAVAQDSRTGMQRYLVGTRYEYLRSKHALPAKYWAYPEMPVRISD